MQSDEQDLMELRLIAIRYAANDTCLFEFSKLDGSGLPAATAGAHIDLHLPNGLIRQYSLVNPQQAPKSYVVGIKRDAQSRGGSKFLHDQLRVGAILRVSHPRNNFELVEAAPHIVLIAGGIGITPIYAMVQELRRNGRAFTLHYACRSRADAAFLAELSDLTEAHIRFDNESGGTFLDINAVIGSAPAESHFYCCGPTPMLADFEAATEALPAERVHVEYFTAKSEAASEGGFIVELARTGQAIEVSAGQSILSALMDAGVDVTYSCTEGICGACETRVISGTPDHRDSILTEQEQAEGKTMMICCSGCKSDRLVLDL